MDQRRIIPSRRAVLATGACALIATGLRSTEAQADLRLRGTVVKWQGTLPGDWVGGNVDMLEAAIKDPALEKVRWRYEWLLGMLKGKTSEIACVHPDVSGIKTKSPSLIKISKLALKSNLANKEERDAFWKALGEGVIRDQAPKGSEVKLGMEDPALKVGGKPAYLAIFQVDQPGGGLSFEFFHLVGLGAGDWHVIHMVADASKAKARVDDVTGLLRSIRYG
jgi:hypothetical protein